MTDPKTIKTFLGVTRTLVGIGSWLAPSTAMRVFGLGRSGEDTYVTRLFGARDLLLGATLLTTAGTANATTRDMGMACDALDVVAGLDELRRGRLGPYGLFATTAGAALFAGLGLVLRRADGAQTPAGSASAGSAPTGS